MIKIEITRTITENYTEKQNFVVKRTPTDKTNTEQGYGNVTKTTHAYDEELKVEEVPKRREITRTLLLQEIDDDSEFNIAKVIAAINGLPTMEITAINAFPKDSTDL